MTEWEPATEAEAAMREALRAEDQELYFRILSRTELLLPVSADSLAGRAPLGWGTWTTSGRTHVLAFTSERAMQACLAQHAGAARRVSYHELAATWPNLEWWLAVNPGLPIEGYLPAWFVAQLARGDVRLPNRTHRGGPGADQPAGAPPAPPPPAGYQPGPPTGRPGPPPAAAQRQSAPAQPMPAAVPAATLTPPAAPRPAAVPVPAAAAAPGVVADPGAAPAPATDSLPAPEHGAPAAVPAGHPVPVAAGHPAPGGTAAPGPAADQAPAIGGNGAPASLPGPGGPLPRRPLRDPSERPQSMAAAAKALTTGHQTAPPTPVPSQPSAPAENGTAPADDGTAPAAAMAAAPPIAPPAAAPQPMPPPSVPPAASPPAGPADPAAAAAVGPAPAVPSMPRRPGPPLPPDFVPANEVEEELLAAVAGGSTDSFLSTLLLAQVLLPVAADSAARSRPGDEGFSWRTEQTDGERYVVVFTSKERLADHLPELVETISVKFGQLIRHWPDPSWSFAVNPGTPVGATLPGGQILALANWAAEVGLASDDVAEPPAEVQPARPAGRSGAAQRRDDPRRPTMMQKAVAPSQVDYYLERGYDRVCGFVHRLNEVEHLRTPAALREALGLGYAGSPFRPDADEIFVLRWPAYRPSLYRIPYGGQSESAMRAMEGWVIERAPFRGNGFAPGDGADVIAEFKVDSARLPHGAQLWRLRADGSEHLVAMFDCDAPVWRRVGEQ